MLTFAWDERKAATNLKKHGVSFDEARTVFSDEHARLIADPDNSADEDRFIILGLSERTRLLVVCHCYRESDSIIRIINARKATRQEARSYGSFKK
jgi:uncharacterized DUF497 family protein